MNFFSVCRVSALLSETSINSSIYLVTAPADITRHIKSRIQAPVLNTCQLRLVILRMFSCGRRRFLFLLWRIKCQTVDVLKIKHR